MGIGRGGGNFSPKSGRKGDGGNDREGNVVASGGHGIGEYQPAEEGKGKAPTRVGKGKCSSLFPQEREEESMPIKERFLRGGKLEKDDRP